MESLMFIVDAHLDLAYNAIRNERNLLNSISEVRAADTRAARTIGTAIVSFPELKKAGVGIVFSTIFVGPTKSPMFNDGEKLVYSTNDEAHRQAQIQLDYYHELWDEVDYIHPVFSLNDLEKLVEGYGADEAPQIGIVILMEGADPIRHPDELEMWFESG
jgi:membrane dipeptidase